MWRLRHPILYLLSYARVTFGRAGSLLLISKGDVALLVVLSAGLTACPTLNLVLLVPLPRHLAYCGAHVARTASPVEAVSELIGRLPGRLLFRLLADL